MALHVAGVPFALGEGLVFGEEFGCRLGEGRSADQLAGPLLHAEAEIPLLGGFLGAVEIAFLRGSAAVLAGHVGRALPNVAARPLVEMELSAREIECPTHHAYAYALLLKKSRVCNVC